MSVNMFNSNRYLWMGLRSISSMHYSNTTGDGYYLSRE